MKKDKKQVRAYSLGGLLFVLIFAFIVAVIVVGGFTLADLESCDGTTVSSLRRAAADNEVLADLSKDETFDVHFIAFDTDLEIDELQEAVVWYKMRSYKEPLNDSNYVKTYGESVALLPLTVSGEENGGNDGGLFVKKYEWKRIQRSRDFLKTVDIFDEARDAVKNTSWVLLFKETKAEISSLVEGNIRWLRGSEVTDCTVLRLKFVRKGRTYNVGAVSAKVTEGDSPVGGAKPSLWKRLIAAIRAVIGFIIKHWLWFVVGIGAILLLSLIVWLIRLNK